MKLGPIFAAVVLLAAVPVAAASAPRGDEPVAVPTSIKQGIDFVYADPQLTTIARKNERPRNWLRRIFSGSREGQSNPNPIFLQLTQGLEQYQATWGSLPQHQVAAGPVLRRGATGTRVTQLRRRLGLSADGGFDDQLFELVSEYQRVHGLTPVDGIVGRGTLASLNKGADPYLQRIAINIDRAYRLPATNTFDRYIVVDSGAAEVFLFRRDRVADAMRVVVGAPQTKTPMIAVLMRTAKANPYWNVPPDLIASLTARRVREQGLSYLRDYHYQVLSDWSANARVIDPATVDWRQVAAGKSDIWVRQLPGPWNSMGEMKFEMPNDFGIYLHDTPNKDLFNEDNRWVSNGCVRLEDYRRFASWVFPRVPQPNTRLEERFELPQPVPVYMTYFTVAPSAGGVVFRPDPYGFDELAMPQMFAQAGAAGVSS